MAYPATYNISYYQGDLYEFTITPKTANGTEFDLTDYAVKFYIATARGTGATQYECNAEVSGNTITCQIPGGTGKNLTAGTTYVYDVQIKKSSESGPDRIHTLLTGNITVTADVTRMSGD
jgi:hypothetical protein